jgi:hypothetical protein
MSVESVLLSLARRAVEQVMAEVQRQTNLVETEILEQMKLEVGPNLDQIWVGEDATEFRSKVLGPAVTQANNIISHNNSTRGGLETAKLLVNNADRQVARTVAELDTQFRRI